MGRGRCKVALPLVCKKYGGVQSPSVLHSRFRCTHEIWHCTCDTFIWANEILHSNVCDLCLSGKQFHWATHTTVSCDAQSKVLQATVNPHCTACTQRDYPSPVHFTSRQDHLPLPMPENVKGTAFFYFTMPNMFSCSVRGVIPLLRILMTRPSTEGPGDPYNKCIWLDPIWNDEYAPLRMWHQGAWKLFMQAVIDVFSGMSRTMYTTS